MIPNSLLPEQDQKIPEPAAPPEPLPDAAPHVGPTTADIMAAHDPSQSQRDLTQTRWGGTTARRDQGMPPAAGGAWTGTYSDPNRGGNTQQAGTPNPPGSEPSIGPGPAPSPSVGPATVAGPGPAPATGQTTAQYIGPASIRVGDTTFSIADINQDGSIKWSVHKPGQPVSFQTMTQDQFAQSYGSDMASKYYGQQSVLPQQGQYPVQSYGTNSFVSEGTTFSIKSINPDGTIDWQSSNGPVFEGISPYEAALYFGAGVARYYPGYGGSAGAPAAGQSPGTGTGGTAGGVTPGGELNPIPQDPNATGGSVDIGGQTISVPGITAPQLPATPTPSSYDPAQAGMTYDETVEGRVLGMLQSGNPLLEKAAAMTLQRANQRGLLNSSMANDAAMSAMMQNAIPIAQADAGNLLQMRMQNAGFANTASQFNADAANQLAKLGFTAQADLMKTALGGNIELQKLLTAGQADAAMELIRAQSNAALKELELLADDRTRASQSVAQTMTTLQQGVTAILGSNLDAQAKSAAVNQLVQHARASITLYGNLAGNINLLEQFDSIIGAQYAPSAPAAPSTGGDGTNLPSGDSPYIGEVREFGGQNFQWNGMGWSPLSIPAAGDGN